MSKQKREDQYPAVLMTGGQYAVAQPGATIKSIVDKINQAKRAGDHIVILDLWTMDPFIGLEEVTHEETGLVIDDIRIVTTVKKGGSVVIPGFGSFKQHARAARNGVNPSTGAKIKISAAKLPKFTPGTGFKAAVDPRAAARKAAKADAAKPAAKSGKAVKAAKPVAKKAAKKAK